MINIKSYIFDWYLKVKATAWSSKNEVFSVLWDDTLKIRIKAPREDWKANRELISFLSKQLWIKKDDIEIISWQTSESKVLKIKNI